MAFLAQVESGIHQHRKDVAASRAMIGVMNPIPDNDLTDIYAIAHLLADSNPAEEHTWRVDIGHFKAISDVHKKQWDMKTHGKNQMTVGSFLQNAMFRPFAVTARYRNRVYSTMTNKVSAIYHDTITRETIPPMYFYTKGAYPNLALLTTGNGGKRSDAIDRIRLNDILENFRFVRNASYSAGTRYRSKQYRAEIFTKAGLTASQQDAIQLMNAIGFNCGGWGTGTLTGQGLANSTLGNDLHTVHNVDLGNGVNRQVLIVAIIACHASFNGVMGWTLMNRALIQGAWPWLGGYTKMYAKTIFTAMICLFCCVRHGYVWNDVGSLILRLAGKLVDPGCFGVGRVKLRQGSRLGGEKVLYEPVPKAKKYEKGNTEGSDAEKENEKIPQPAESFPDAQSPPIPSWTYSSPHIKDISQSLPQCSHIVPGTRCNHGNDLHFTGRITLVSSVDELQAACDGTNTNANEPKKSSIIVTKTFNDAHAVFEVESYLRKERILAVRRGSEQCTSCAVRLAHLIGAMVVVA